MSEPHRGKCHFNWRDNFAVLEDEERLLTLPWVEALDYAVYHSPEASPWARFRKFHMNKKAPSDRTGCLLAWLYLLRGNPNADAKLIPTVTLIQVMNYCRSMRGMWSTLPSIRNLAADLKVEWDRRRAERRCVE